MGERKATRSSTLARSKRVENRVVRYLAGPEAIRDWKDEHDISVEDCNCRWWIGEVKSMAWPSGPARLWSMLLAALRQAQKHSDRAFAVLVPCNAEVGNALVMYEQTGQPVITTLERFRCHVLGLGDADGEAGADRKAA